jgi:hypothetical protein
MLISASLTIHFLIPLSAWILAPHGRHHRILPSLQELQVPDYALYQEIEFIGIIDGIPGRFGWYYLITVLLQSTDNALPFDVVVVLSIVTVSRDQIRVHIYRKITQPF